jgi:hypothetical protein
MRIMRTAFLTLLLAISLVLASGKPGGSVANATTGSGSCTTSVENPHYSSGAGGVIAKSRVTCTASVNYYDGDFLLFVCRSNPTGPENTWASQYGCVQKAVAGAYLSPPYAGTVYSFYVPALGSPGAHGTGYWVACMVWYYDSIDERSGMTRSNGVYISA